MTDRVLIGKGTFISFSVVSSIVGATMLFSGVKEQAENNSTSISGNEVKIEKLRDTQNKVREQLSNIEGKLDIIIKRVTK